jgi:hypothetical protein
MPSLNLPTPNKTPGDGQPAGDINLVIEAVNTLNTAVDNIPAGPQGPQGEPGTPGAAGAAATITVASTTTTEPGSDAQVVEGGTEQNRTLAFYIPRGATGATGSQGPQGEIGPTGPQGERGPSGYGVVAGGSTGYVLAKASNTDYDTEWIPAGAAPPVSSVDGRTGAVTLSDLYDAAGDAAAAQAAAEAYADSLAPNYDPAGSAASAQTAAEAYADGLAVNYDPAGAAASAQAAAESYADGLAVNYDPAGAAASAQAAAESYADGLAVNYDPAGSASAVAGDLSSHESATTSVHGISDTSDLVYTNDARLSDERTPLDGSVTTDKIVDANVTNAKLENDSITINGSAVALGGSVTISGLPDQSGNAGEYLTTDGTNASWAPIVTDPTPTVFLLGGM